MRKLAEADYAQMPWKNGGGITTQLAVSPQGAGLDDFDWRISTAQVNNAGPFSSFPGIDRSLAVMQGPGLILHMDDGTPFILTTDSSPLCFSGERRVQAKLVDGSIIDFNVMTQRQRCTHLLQRMEMEGSRQIARQADLLFIHCAQGRLVDCSNASGEAIRLSTGESVLADCRDGEHIELAAANPARLYIIHIKFKESDHARP
jgi:uncharacterized protein